VQAESRSVRCRNLWDVNGRPTHSVAGTSTLVLAGLRAMNDVPLPAGDQTAA
jgi:hypothetical protein